MRTRNLLSMAMLFILAFFVGCNAESPRNSQNANTEMTAQDQSENSADLAVTQQVRKDIVADNTLSTNAKNIKVITSGGVVTLKGNVNNEQEHANILRIVKKVNGVKDVNDELVVSNQ